MDFSWGELAVIAAVAFLLLGPEDMVAALKKGREWWGKIKEEFESIKELLVKATDEPKKQMLDMEGNLRETYDLSDIKPLIKPSKNYEPIP